VAKNLLCRQSPLECKLKFIEKEEDMKPKGKGARLTTQKTESNFVKTHSLNQQEENALRMLHGMGANAQALLPKACGGNEEVADELLLVEMQLFRIARMQQAQAKVAQPSPQKSKIISALRAKK
jgi:hypothetical protein